MRMTPSPHIFRRDGCRRWLACSLLTASTFLSWVTPASGQLIERFNSTPVEASGPDDWIHTRWSWLHDWESRNGLMLREPALILPPADDRQPVTPGQRQALQQAAVEALIRASMPGRPSIVRQQATIALGRIGDKAGVERLLQLLNDRDDHVNEVAWMALGLAQAPQAREKLLDPGTLTRSQTIGWIVAVALMDKPPENVLRTLAELVKQTRDAEVAAMALWAMRHHSPAGLLDAAKLIMHEATDPLLVSEAMLITGQQRATDQISHFKAILMTRRSGVIAATRQMVQSIRYDTTEAEINVIGAQVASLRTAAALALGEYAYPPENRHGQRAREALRMIFEEAPPPAGLRHGQRAYTGFAFTGATPYEIRFAATQLGRIGYAQDMELLIRILRTPRLQDALGNGLDARYFMRRSHAAIGIGLYLRRMTELGIIMEPTDLPDARHTSTGDRALWRRNGALEGEDPDQTRYILRKTLRSLIDVASDPQEPYDLRAACLLALGISNSPARQADIRAVLNSPAGRHRIVAAYGVLALGLLGDPETTPAASKLLKHPPARSLTTDQLMAMRLADTLPPGEIIVVRALLQAISKIESTQAADLARGQFGREQWTSRQAILALRLLGDTGLVHPLTEMLDRFPQMQREERQRGQRVPAPLPADQVAAITAWSLGHLLRPTAEDRLAQVFQRGSNYTLPLAPLRIKAPGLKQHDIVYRFRCHADPIFYELLTPALPPRPELEFRY